MRELFIGDLHFDCRRSVGTTTQSVYDMEEEKLGVLKYTIDTVDPDIVYILGDLFDRPEVSDTFKVKIYELFRDSVKDIVILRGNHDNRSNRFDKVCSLELIGSISSQLVSVVYSEPEKVNDCWLIPHCFNQAQFDRHIAEVPANMTVLLHCNVMSWFADSELSLNLSKEQIDSLFERGCDIITGHEHTHRRLYNDGLIVLGCFLPTSISDCEDDKYVMVKDDGKTEFIKVWDKSTQYIKVPWTELDTITDQSIIEVTGEVSISEAIDATKAVAELRKRSNAYMVKNSVKVVNADLSVDKEDITNFNIIDIFMKSLDKETKVIVEGIINELPEQD